MILCIHLLAGRDLSIVDGASFVANDIEGMIVK